MKLDPKFTKRIQDYLNTEPAERDVTVGAMLLLQIIRNRALYNSAISRPAKYADKVEYELKKHLRIRLANMTLNEVAALEKTVMPAAEKILDAVPVISTDDEIPQGKRKLGKRNDHDQLPENIQKLWNDNFDLYKQVKQLFEECKSMNHLQPCDRFDKIKILEAADRKYRENLAHYDSYVLTSEPEVTEQKELSAVDVAKEIGNARKKLSKYRSAYVFATSDDRRESAKMRIQEAVNTLIERGATFAPNTIEDLKGIGIIFE